MFIAKVYIPKTMLGVKGIAVNKTDKNPSFMQQNYIRVNYTGH